MYRRSSLCTRLLLRIERVFALFVKFVLQLQACVINLDCPKSFDHGLNPAFEVPLTEFFGGDGAIAGIVIGEARIPPDAGINLLRKFYASLVRARFLFGAVNVNKVG